MSIIQHSSYRILPHQAEEITTDNAIEQRLRDGEVVSYEDIEDMSEPRFRDLRPELEEVPGEGWRVVVGDHIDQAESYYGVE